MIREYLFIDREGVSKYAMVTKLSSSEEEEYPKGEVVAKKQK